MPRRFFNSLLFLWNAFLDIIFPWQCCFCKKETKQYPLCENCRKNISINSSFICPACQNRIYDFSKYCCSKNNSIVALGISSFYDNPILKKAIHSFKYQSIASLEKPLSGLMIKFLEEAKFISTLKNTNIDKANIIIIPIPLHPKKQKQRGFNQSELLAQNISAHFALNLESQVLFRVKNNPSQAKILSFSERKVNVEGIFQIALDKADLLKNKWIILVDDVYTSGATMQEAATILKSYGAKKIIGLVLAKG
ncbi:MAG: phosphoribosyltransferase family protein [Candidatus Pacebacteria bacterium]|nr:phosphoribosyltransferase family protein [Candidatus Paceibacterota bacterium]